MPDSERYHGPDGILSPSTSTSTSTRRTRASLEQLLNTPARRKTPLGTDTAWALKLKECVDAAAREMKVEILSAKPMATFDPTIPSEARDMSFELETNLGRLECVRMKTGKHEFYWVE